MKKLSLLTLILPLLFLISACDKSEDPEYNPPLLKGWTAGSPYDGYGVILYTSDGGKNWTRQGLKDVIPNVTISFIAAVDENIVWACGESSDAKPTILKTTDGGKNWIRLEDSRGIPLASYGGIGGADELHAWAAGDSGVIIATTDGGTTWTRQDHEQNPDVVYGSMSVVDKNHIWAIGALYDDDKTKPFISYTSDGGGHWFRQGENAFPEAVEGFIDVHAISPDYCWVVGTAHSAFATTDGGQTWISKMVSGSLAHNNGVCIVDHNDTWVATDYSTAYFYSGLQDKWTHFQLHTSPESIWPVTIGVSAMDKDILWMVTTAGGTEVMGEIFHSNDGGKNWIKQDIPVVSAFRRITFPKAMR